MPVITVKDCLTCHVNHEWLFDGPTLKELRTIKKLTGLSGMDFAEASDAGDPDALAALLYVLHKRSGINLRFEDVDADLTSIDVEETADEKAEREALEAELAGGEGKAETEEAPNGLTEEVA